MPVPAVDSSDSFLTSYRTGENDFLIYILTNLRKNPATVPLSSNPYFRPPEGRRTLLCGEICKTGAVPVPITTSQGPAPK